jgi:hypothetical protein
VCRVVHPGQDADGAIEQAKAHKLAALRENGEAREIYFEEPEAVITDVPRRAVLAMDPLSGHTELGQERPPRMPLSEGTA